MHPVLLLRLFVLVLAVASCVLPYYTFKGLGLKKRRSDDDALTTQGGGIMSYQPDPSGPCYAWTSQLHDAWGITFSICCVLIGIDIIGCVVSGASAAPGGAGSFNATEGSSYDHSPTGRRGEGLGDGGSGPGRIGASSGGRAPEAMRTTRWWGRKEKTVTRLTVWGFWAIAVFQLYVFASMVIESRFRCFSAKVAFSILLLFMFVFLVPLWSLIITDAHPHSSRYLPHEDAEDDLEDVKDNPVSYQVWIAGRLVFASVSQIEVKRWILNARSGTGRQKGPLASDKAWRSCVVREVQL